jgi:hypothetical protein
MESQVSNSPSPEEVAAGRVAYRNVRRYQKSSSTLFLGLFFFAPLISLTFSHALAAHALPAFRLPSLVGLFGLCLFLIVHAMSRRTLKSKYETGSAILNDLHSRYGLQVDKLLKPKLSLL